MVRTFCSPHGTAILSWWRSLSDHRRRVAGAFVSLAVPGQRGSWRQFRQRATQKPPVIGGKQGPNTAHGAAPEEHHGVVLLWIHYLTTDRCKKVDEWMDGNFLVFLIYFQDLISFNISFWTGNIFGWNECHLIKAFQNSEEHNMYLYI